MVIGTSSSFQMSLQNKNYLPQMCIPYFSSDICCVHQGQVQLGLHESVLPKVLLYACRLMHNKRAAVKSSLHSPPCPHFQIALDREWAEHFKRLHWISEQLLQGWISLLPWADTLIPSCPTCFCPCYWRKETDSKHQTWTGYRIVLQSPSDWEWVSKLMRYIASELKFCHFWAWVGWMRFTM